MTAPLHYLREWRRHRKLTQAELAAKADTYKSIISRIETAKHGLEATLMLRICAALDITPSQLFAKPGALSPDVRRFLKAGLEQKFE